MKQHLFKTITTAMTMLFAIIFVQSATAQEQTKEAYVLKSTDGTTLTFCYDTEKAKHEGNTVYGINDMQNVFGTESPAWTGNSLENNTKITVVVFDTSFK